VGSTNVRYIGITYIGATNIHRSNEGGADMAPDNAARSVLLIGKSQVVLDDWSPVSATSVTGPKRPTTSPTSPAGSMRESST
jgi:hypothetical protein